MSSSERCVVLVADDEPPVLKLVSQVLARHGYKVISASDGPTALEACLRRQGPIHLALLDVMMPGMTGPQLAECLKVRDPKIAVLFTSGYRSDQIADLSPGIKHSHFIAKPFLPKHLIQRIDEILGNAGV